MSKRQRMKHIVCVSGIMLLIVCSISHGIMTISLKNKEVITIPVTKGEVQSISYGYGFMTITVRNSDVITIPVARKEVQSITYEGEPDTTHGITWGFETGDLRGWTSTGNAFTNQPTYGDNPKARNREPSNHQGDYWIGGFENRHRPSDPAGQVQRDDPQGALTSQPFTIGKPTISFLIGGGGNLSTERVELLIDGRAVFRATGKCTETMERIKWDVSRFIGQQARFQLVDSASSKWGHINFDDVRFK